MTAIGNVTPAAASNGIRVYVGYADSYRANATSFPTPWVGSPRTIFQGCNPAASCVYDGGAVQVYNGSGSTVHVDGIAVAIDTCVYSGWPSVNLPSGYSLIVTQLQSGAVSGCINNQPPNSMDTSDVGPNNSSNTGVCFPKNNIEPTVDVTIDGTTTHYLDTKQVLNTSGIDMGDCPVGTNESTQWTIPGNPPCHNSALTLAPASQSHPVFTTAAVTATFTACAQPLANAAVDFAVTAGPNAGLGGSGITDGQGQAPFSYSSSHVGTDAHLASITNLAGTINSNPVTVTWTVGFAQGGAFVISDLKNVQGGPVYWWGAQWWKYDHLSTGLAPASFKGYENSNATPQCGQFWTTRPGNSPPPPKTVSQYMAVIVASHVTKSGSTISGNIVHIVIVRTNPGYQANPGHIGTGTIVSTVC